jgi:hypothetical protein
MRHLLVRMFVVLGLVISIPVFAQDAEGCASADDALETIAELIEEAGDSQEALSLIRDTADAALAECESEPVGDTFSVVTPQAVNLRSCAGTTCSIIRQSTAGEIFAASGTEAAADGDWYQIDVDGQTGFVSAALTTRGPDAVLDIDEPHTDLELLCVVAFDIQRGDPDLQFLLTGEAQDEVTADIFRPRENTALRVQGQNVKTFIDTGDVYTQQYYGFNVSWPLGTYQMELKRDDVVKRFAFEMTERGAHNIYVLCE